MSEPASSHWSLWNVTVTTAARKSPSRTGWARTRSRELARRRSACVVTAAERTRSVAGIALEGRLQPRGTGLGTSCSPAATEGTFSTKTRSLPHPSRATWPSRTLLRERAREARSSSVGTRVAEDDPHRLPAFGPRRIPPDSETVACPGKPEARETRCHRCRVENQRSEDDRPARTTPSQPRRESVRVASRSCPTTPAPGGAEAPKPPRAAESP